MKVLFLGNVGSPLVEIIRSFDDEVIISSEKITAEFLDLHQPDFMVSYGYPFIIEEWVLKQYPNKIINLHRSYLPWNRGAEPVIWSFLENTRKGITIHYVDQGIDTGDIIVQKEVDYKLEESLNEHYKNLQAELESLFKHHWESIKNGTCNSLEQQGEGSFHLQRDKEKYLELFKNGEDIIIKEILKFAEERSFDY
ncbi:MAG: formyl transferase [Bacteroidia bacterium]|nr:formyl transferase [Bacteroidia bacterium]